MRAMIMMTIVDLVMMMMTMMMILPGDPLHW